MTGHGARDPDNVATRLLREVIAGGGITGAFTTCFPSLRGIPVTLITS